MRHTRPVPRTLTEQEQLSLLRETGRTVDDFRDHIIVALALGSGLRVGELVALDVATSATAKGSKVWSRSDPKPPRATVAVKLRFLSG